VTATSTSTPDAFVTVPGDRHSEVARTLAEPVPQALSALDQLGLWGNLGVSLLGFTGAVFVLQPGGTGTPELSLAVALTAIVLGAVLGTLPVALAGLPGTRTGAPAMVLLRGLFGARLSYLPTALNILQCLGPLGPVGPGPRPLADAAAVGGRLRHLPAHQPGIRLLVGLGVDPYRPGDRLHPRHMDVRVHLLVRGRRGGHPRGRRPHIRRPQA